MAKPYPEVSMRFITSCDIEGKITECWLAERERLPIQTCPDSFGNCESDWYSHCFLLIQSQPQAHVGLGKRGAFLCLFLKFT